MKHNIKRSNRRFKIYPIMDTGIFNIMDRHVMKIEAKLHYACMSITQTTRNRNFLNFL